MEGKGEERRDEIKGEKKGDGCFNVHRNNEMEAEGENKGDIRNMEFGFEKDGVVENVY